MVVQKTRALRLSDVSPADVERIPLRSDWDLALDGGAVPGMIIIIYGKGGAGKTTDMLLLSGEHGAAYMSSERKLPEIAAAAKVLSVNDRKILPAEVRTMHDVCEHVSATGQFLNVLDSWNALRRPEPDQIDDLREVLGDGICFIVCHMTKDGDLRGSEELFHKVDAVVRLQRAHFKVEKNWHGPLHRVARQLPTFSRKAKLAPEPPRSSPRIVVPFSRSRGASVAKPKIAPKRIH